MQQPPPGWGSPGGGHGPHAPNPYQPPAAHAPPPGQPNAGDQALGLIVPINVRNGLAFVAGYLGLGAFFCLGPILGVPAIVTGVLALRKPELGGQGRAWTGIVLGALGSLWGLVFLLWRF